MNIVGTFVAYVTLSGDFQEMKRLGNGTLENLSTHIFKWKKELLVQESEDRKLEYWNQIQCHLLVVLRNIKKVWIIHRPWTGLDSQVVLQNIREITLNFITFSIPFPFEKLSVAVFSSITLKAFRFLRVWYTQKMLQLHWRNSTAIAIKHFWEE